ncbi:MAG: 50S ribosomal protein L10 [Candidatus Bathyarchaeota archaeon B26-2]|nr:MAG: 50S ribosomal protein L10 [Candidatus Bathyarchaeota archaeon B26-2]
MLQRQVLVKKAEEVKEIISLIEKYRAIGVADIHKVRAAQLQGLRKKLKEEVYMRVFKNNLMLRAISECKDRPDLEKLRDYLKGSNIFLFTNLNPFKLALLLEESKVEIIAKAGDVATKDIVVPAGNTGLPPGPIISQFNAVGLPTRIEGGSVWINRDTLVVKKGEVISERLAAVLSKLGIKAVEAGLSMKVIYDDGLIIAGEDLKLDLEGFKKSITEAYTEALSLSIGVAYPTPENIQLLIQKAYREAYSLAINASIITPESITDLIRKAHIEAAALQAQLGL